MSEKNLILDKAKTLQKIKRIAYEIYERNHQEGEIVIAGIWDRGYFFAELLKAELEKIFPAQVTLIKIELEKYKNKQVEVRLNYPIEQLNDKVVIITDDVLNTGRTIAYSFRPFLEVAVKKMQVAVIVDRNQKTFPVLADYVGYTMATTLMQHVECEFEEHNLGVYLH